MYLHWRELSASSGVGTYPILLIKWVISAEASGADKNKIMWARMNELVGTAYHISMKPKLYKFLESYFWKVTNLMLSECKRVLSSPFFSGEIYQKALQTIIGRQVHAKKRRKKKWLVARSYNDIWQCSQMTALAGDPIAIIFQSSRAVHRHLMPSTIGCSPNGWSWPSIVDSCG
jgi:hypothetical protein